MKAIIFSLLLISLQLVSCGQEKQQNKETTKSKLPDCEWCGATEAPENLSWKTVIAPESEDGERIFITGIVFKNDSKTPAPNVLIYVYHTNNKGIYPKLGNETGNAQRHGYLRAWVRTNEKGEYAFSTIKPKPYPSGKDPSHIHITLSPQGESEYWIDPFLFDDDTLVDDKERKKQSEIPGFSHILTLQKNSKGVWQGKRNIILR